MQYTQITDNCFADRIGAQGLAPDVFGPLLEKSESALQWIRDAHAQDSLPLLRLPAARDDLADARCGRAQLLLQHLERTHRSAAAILACLP